MGKLNPNKVANWLVENGTNIEYKKLQDVLYDILEQKISKWSEEQIWDFIEEYSDDVARELFRKEDQFRIDGIEPTFDISDEDDIHYISFFDRPEIEFLRKLQSDTPENFEYFCKNLLIKLGGSAEVTGGSYDGGIDFIGYDLQINNLPQASTIGSNILVVGQSKRYTGGNHVNEKELREFVGASIKRIDTIKIQKESIGILQPIILAFWTTSDFHANAIKYAKKMGIWYLNGIALSQMALKLNMKASQSEDTDK